MAGPVDNRASDDELIVAYLDGELAAGDRAEFERRIAGDAALAARLAELRRGGRDFAAAYDLLLGVAPAERLAAMLKQVARAKAPARRGLPWWTAIAAAVLLFAAGVAAGVYGLRFIPGLTRTQVAEAPAQPNWRQVVAEYYTLTTAETLAAIPVNQAVLDLEVAALSKRVSLDLSLAKLALPHVYLKRADAFDFRGRPLVQFAYLSPEAGPIAFCIIANGRPDAAVAFEQREGSNIVFWTKDGKGYMLIGKAPRDALEQYAASLATQVS